MPRFALSFMVVLALSACAVRAPLEKPGIEQRPSLNFDQRRPNYVIIHYTSDNNAEQALRTLTNDFSQVSAHYLIARDGRVYQLVDELARAWHAGESYWGGNRDMNSASLGIELDNNGEEPFAEPQLAALLDLLADLKERYKIPAANFLGHADVAPRRKPDPGRLFPWQRLAASGFGLWCDPPYAAPPPGGDGLVLLSAFGYDIAHPAAAIAAFKTHFVPTGDTTQLTDDDRALLACLIAKRTGQ